MNRAKFGRLFSIDKTRFQAFNKRTRKNWKYRTGNQESKTALSSFNEHDTMENYHRGKMTTFYPEFHPMDNLQQVHPVNN